jgi:hypothetical protein
VLLLLLLLIALTRYVCDSVPNDLISFVFSKIRNPSKDDAVELQAALAGVDPMAEVNEFGADDSDDEPLVGANGKVDDDNDDDAPL